MTTNWNLTWHQDLMIAGAIATWAVLAGDLAVNCLVPAGGAMATRPLLSRASVSGATEGHRRVIHLEYAAEPLPDGLEWNEDAVVEP